MAFNPNQFRKIIKQSLEPFDPAMITPAAVELLCLTCAVESDFGTHLHQFGGGPARGCMMIEPPTYHDVVDRVILPRYPAFTHLGALDLETNIKASIIVARCKYWPFPQPLPSADDIPALARYWKRYYNTRLGKGTVEDAVEKHERYCR